MRYAGQGHEITVALPAGPLEAGHAAEVVEAFERAYRGLYGRLGPRVPLEIVNWRVTVSGPRPGLDFRLAASGAAGGGAPKGVRKAYFPEAGGFVDTPVYDRYALRPGDGFAGPAIVEEGESTLVVGPRGRGRVDQHLNVIVDLGGWVQ